MKEPDDNLLTENGLPFQKQFVLKIAVPYPLWQGFDYLPPEGIDPHQLRPGIRVEVPFGLGEDSVVGYLLEVREYKLEGNTQLKPVYSLIDQQPLLSQDDCVVLNWASRYYHHPLGEVFATAFPTVLKIARQERRLCITEAGQNACERHEPQLELFELAESHAHPNLKARLLDLLQERKHGIGLSELNKLDWDWNGPARALIEKAWAIFKMFDLNVRTTKTLLVRRLCLSDSGRIASATKSSTRQNMLLEMLKSSGDGISEKVLKNLGWDWKTPAQSLVQKGWAYFEEVEEGTDIQAQHQTANPPNPNPAQQNAINAVLRALGGYGVFLLEGVTGSGKTEVYLRLLEQVLERGQQAMILVPEINLTPQLEARFRARFDAPLVVFHSGLSDAERCRSWLAMQRGEASILLGTRSAVFTPMAKPGLIILDEEHDSSFKQQEGFRFHARDVAIMRAREKRIPILMGSATPSLESLANTLRGRYTLLSLPERTGNAVHPSYRLVDIRKQRLNEGLSSELITQIGETLARGEQALLFLNRRGFAPTLICHVCGWVAGCKHCDARMVVHSSERKLRCHHCGHEQALLRDCPECKTADLRPLGLGTERVELALAKLFPEARTLRIDRDSTRRKGSLEVMLGKIQAGEVDILLGTQMLAKGHHFPNVTLVGILDVDGGLFSLDFRAGERTAQMIVQVAGRAGREERPGQVLLQTRQPDHPLLRKLIREGYPVFAAAALLDRYEAGLPPYSYQALWRADAKNEEIPAQFLARLVELASTQADVLALGPVPAPMPRQANRHRQQLLLQSTARKPLHAMVDRLISQIPTLSEAKRVRWSVDVDPLDLY